MLDISRLDAEAVKPTVEDFPLSLLFDQIGEAYRTVAASEGDGFLDPPPRHGCAKRPDIAGTNSRQPDRERHSIHWDRHAVRVECRPLGDRIRIEVQDTGIGIPPDQMDDIWKEFHQVGNPERDRNKGLGLGLAIVQRLAKLLGCRVEVLSSLGRGSIFSIEVPVGTSGSTGTRTDAGAGRQAPQRRQWPVCRAGR